MNLTNEYSRRMILQMNNYTLRKTISLTVLALMTAFVLCACGGKKESEVTVDSAKLAKQLAEETVTSEELTELASSMIAGTYYISDDISAGGSAWKGTGATACEVAVIEVKDSSKTKDVEGNLKEHIDSQSELYASYNAGEVEKLDKAILKSAGKYTVMCVCDDTDKAESILKDYGF